MQDIIHELFAVTRTSIYQIHDTADEGFPLVQKISCDNQSEVSTGQKLETGNMIAFGKVIVVYRVNMRLPRRERKLEAHLHERIPANTSSVVALFFTAKEAQECFRQERREPNDKRWRQQTKNVLDAIGDKHPVFDIMRKPQHALSVNIEPA